MIMPIPALLLDACRTPRSCVLSIARPEENVPCERQLESLWGSNPQVTADLARKLVIDLCVPGNCTSLPGDRVMPPRMTGTLTQKLAAVTREMSQQLTAFHRAIGSSS